MKRTENVYEDACECALLVVIRPIGVGVGEGGEGAPEAGVEAVAIRPWQGSGTDTVSVPLPCHGLMTTHY